MDQPVFSWRSFDRMSQVLQSVGYVVIVFGSIAGIVMVAVGDNVVRMMGFVTIGASVLVCLYHMSFSMLMSAFHDLAEHVEKQLSQKP